MTKIRLLLCVALAALAVPAPAAAPISEKAPVARPAVATELPEGDSWPLFLLGVAGVLIGRRLSRGKIQAVSAG